MQKSLHFKLGTFFTHVIMWGLVGSFTLLWQPLSWRLSLPDVYWIKQGILFALMLTLFYSNTQYFVPRLLNDNKITPFVIINIAMAIGVGLIIEQYEIRVHLREQLNQAFKLAREVGIVKREEVIDHFSILVSLSVLGMSTILASIQKWQTNRRIQAELEREKVQSELSYLRAQINPHFFFNTLNNIYALTQIDQFAAGEAVHKLSQMMRYVLYDTTQDKVLLSQEISFIQNYTELMRLRLTSNVDISIETPEMLKEASMAPMLILPFIENAFKHGISTTNKSAIKIRISQDQYPVEVEVINTLFTDKQVTLDESNGIGLANTRRRLDLLYPNQYELTVCEKPETSEFYVLLKLKSV